MTYIPEIYDRWFDRLNTDTMGTCTFTVSTRTFSVAPKAWEQYFSFWSGRKFFRKDSTQSVVRPTTSWTYYFYFDTDWVLQYIANASITQALFKTVAITWLVYWNATTSKAIVQAVDEQHGMRMDASTHFNLHLSRGARYMQWWNITWLADASDEYTSISTLVSADEDITMVTMTSTTIPFLYRNWTDWAWEETATWNLKLGHNGWWNVYYNQNTTGTTWQLTAVASNKYVIYYFLWTNDKNNPIKKIVWQHFYSGRGDARDALQNEMGRLRVDWFPSVEAYLMFGYIVKYNWDLEDDWEWNTYVDLRRDLIFNAS